MCEDFDDLDDENEDDPLLVLLKDPPVPIVEFGTFEVWAIR